MSGHFRLFIVILALIAATEPLLHSHPLTTSDVASSKCAVCASAARITPAVPIVAAPHVIVYALAAAPAQACGMLAPLTLPSRAPPTA